MKIAYVSSRTDPPGHGRSALTQIELLVVIAIVSLLFAILLPAVQNARMTARRIECGSTLRQLALAAHQYLDVHRVFPPGHANGWSQLVLILPYLDESATYSQFDLSRPQPEVESQLGSIPQPRIFACPSDPLWRARAGEMPTGANYVGNCGIGLQGVDDNLRYHGVFEPLGHQYSLFASGVPPAAVTDGLTHTAFWSECLVSGNLHEPLRSFWRAPQRDTHQDFEVFADSCRNLETSGQVPMPRGPAWTQGSELTTWYNHILPPNSLSCTNGSLVPWGAASAVSNHSRGVNLALCDGSLRFISEAIDSAVWRGLGTRDGSESNSIVP